MKKENNIDKLFRDKLEGFSEEPPAFIWNGIREQLVTGIRKKRFAWYRWSAVAAFLILAFTAGWYFNDTADKGANRVGQKELINSEKEKFTDNKSFLPEPLVEETGKDDEEQQAHFIAKANVSREETTKKDTGKAILPENTETSGNKGRERIISPELIAPVEAYLKVQINREPAVKKEFPGQVTGLTVFETEAIHKNAALYASADREKAGWGLGVNVSPGYSSYSAKHGETYASNMTHAATEGNASLGGGISIKYRTAGRWSLESGVYYAQNGQRTGSSPQLFGGRVKDFASAPAEQLYFNTAVTMANSSIAMNSTAGIIEFENVPAGAEIAANLENTDSFKNSFITQGELSQVFDLVEIPLYLRYLLFESKLDVELIGGINAGVVVGNNAFFENQFGVQKIGKTRDISSLNISGTLGLGFTYALGKQFSLALEPRFNYYLNSISNNPEVNFKPYRIGMYTGLYYAF